MSLVMINFSEEDDDDGDGDVKGSGKDGGITNSTDDEVLISE